MFWLRSKKNNFQLHTLIWMSDTQCPIAQSVACLTADPRAASSILAQSHTFMEIDLEIIYTVIVFPLASLSMAVRHAPFP